jgi:hypothetical protein
MGASIMILSSADGGAVLPLESDFRFQNACAAAASEPVQEKRKSTHMQRVNTSRLKTWNWKSTGDSGTGNIVRDVTGRL